MGCRWIRTDHNTAKTEKLTDVDFIEAQLRKLRAGHDGLLGGLLGECNRCTGFQPLSIVSSTLFEITFNSSAAKAAEAAEAALRGDNSEAPSRFPC